MEYIINNISKSHLPAAKQCIKMLFQYNINTIIAILINLHPEHFPCLRSLPLSHSYHVKGADVVRLLYCNSVEITPVVFIEG